MTSYRLFDIPERPRGRRCWPFMTEKSLTCLHVRSLLVRQRCNQIAGASIRKQSRRSDRSCDVNSRLGKKETPTTIIRQERKRDAVRLRHGHYPRIARSRDRVRYVPINGGLFRCVYRQVRFVLLCHRSSIAAEDANLRPSSLTLSYLEPRGLYSSTDLEERGGEVPASRGSPPDVCHAARKACLRWETVHNCAALRDAPASFLSKRSSGTSLSYCSPSLPPSLSLSLSFDLSRANI